MGDCTSASFIWWHTPKLWSDRAGPEASWVKRYALFGIVELTPFSIYWLIQEWPLLLVYFLGIAGSVMFIGW
jgi:hypothetical protein